jgi:hypothetical protein
VTPTYRLPNVRPERVTWLPTSPVAGATLSVAGRTVNEQRRAPCVREVVRAANVDFGDAVELAAEAGHRDPLSDQAARGWPLRLDL